MDGNLSEGFIFPRGEQASIENFTKDAWMNRIFQDDETFKFTIASVTFEPGARNNWHRHPGGQVLLVTAGKGYTQEYGRKMRRIEAGDVVRIAPGVKHWHGAQPDSWLVHLAISQTTPGGIVEWLEPVTDEEYLNLK
jgi:quercetin dioxygenase-like cupin family protein